MDDLGRDPRIDALIDVEPVEAVESAPSASDEAGPRKTLPRIRIDAFVEDAADRDAVRRMAADRRADRATVETFEGGFDAAFTLYETRDAADVIVIEHLGEPEALTGLVDRLAEYCHESARVVVIGEKNDVDLYRRLARRGVSDYLVRPIAPVPLLETLLRALDDDEATHGPLGSVIAMQGARGGAGASMVAHNVADAIATRHGFSTLVIDAYEGFGSASMQFDLEPDFTLADAIKEGDDLTPELLESRIVWRDKRLGLIAAPVAAEPAGPTLDGQFSRVLEMARKIARYVIVDLPTRPTAWSMDAFKSADVVCVVATDDLPSLRNANAIFALLRRSRPNDTPGRLVLNRIAGKTELVPRSQFKRILGVEATVELPVAPMAGKAEHAGKTLREVAPRAAIVQEFDRLAAMLGDLRIEPAAVKRPGLFTRLRGGAS